MNRDVAFYQQAMQQRPGSDTRNLAEIVRVALYLNRTAALAKAFEIEDFPQISIGVDLPSTQSAEARLLPAYFSVENFMNQIMRKTSSKSTVHLSQSTST